MPEATKQEERRVGGDNHLLGHTFKGMVAGLSFPEVSPTSKFHLHLRYLPQRSEGVCCLQTAGSVTSSVLSWSRARLSPGVSLHCFGQLVMYTRFTELKECWEHCCCCLVPFLVWCLLLSFLCCRMEQEED